MTARTPVALRLRRLAQRDRELRALAERLAAEAEGLAPAEGGDWRARFASARAAQPAAVGPWLSDAIYGVNDGLGAVFGIVAGVAGYSHGGRIVLISGLAGLIASSLSMAGGAFLAARSQRDAHHAAMAQSLRRVAEDRGGALAALEQRLRQRGYGHAAPLVVAAIAESGGRALAEALVREEHGTDAEHLPRPVAAALTAGLSTAVGAFVPIVPFFFGEGLQVMLWAAGISLAAHFAVGAAKAALLGLDRLVWSGLEMTAVGAAEGALAFLCGLWAVRLLPR